MQHLRGTAVHRAAAGQTQQGGALFQASSRGIIDGVRVFARRRSAAVYGDPILSFVVTK